MLGNKEDGVRPEPGTDAQSQRYAGYRNTFPQPTIAPDTRRSTAVIGTKPSAILRRPQSARNRTSGITNWKRKKPRAIQHPAEKSARRFIARKPSATKRRSRIASCPWKKFAKMGKNAKSPKTRSQMPMPLSGNRLARSERAIATSIPRFARSHKTNAARYEKNVNGTNKRASNGGWIYRSGPRRSS